MLINFLKDEDTVNYKKTAMVVGFPYCTFKCGRENCQNAILDKSELISIEPEKIWERFNGNPLTKALVLSGLEPFDSLQDLIDLITIFKVRHKSDCDIVIYSGYTEEELATPVSWILKQCGEEISKSIIIKYGRYIAGQEGRYDELLGVSLASDNQYAKKLAENED